MALLKKIIAPLIPALRSLESEGQPCWPIQSMAVSEAPMWKLIGSFLSWQTSQSGLQYSSPRSGIFSPLLWSW